MCNLISWTGGSSVRRTEQHASSTTLDLLERPLRNLRVSVTDRCNLRCRYCMPEDDYAWLPRRDILTFEEVSTLVDLFISVGVNKVRLTGGEPLLRRGLAELIECLAAKSGIGDLAMTTNGVLLAAHSEELRRAGLDRITVSLDTLRPERLIALSRRDSLKAVLAGIDSLASAGFTRTKLDTVVIRDVNDDELGDLLEFGKKVRAEVRFIEYMDVGGATEWNAHSVVSRVEILSRLATLYGDIVPIERTDSAPASRFLLPDGTAFGIVSSTTQPFCASCDRSRLTADGLWYRCLYAPTGTNLRDRLREGATSEVLRTMVTTDWQARRDQGAVDRHRVRGRRVPIPVAVLRTDTHLEMHTRGG
jgi:cyclic pyranopterin phosphate synthase